MSGNMTSEKVDVYIEDLSGEIKEITKQLRGLVLETSDELNEELKWGMPNYSYNGLAVYLQAAKHHVNFGIHKGGKIADKDTKGLFEGSGENMKHIKVRTVHEIDHEYFQMLVKEIMEYNEKA